MVSGVRLSSRPEYQQSNKSQAKKYRTCRMGKQVADPTNLSILKNVIEEWRDFADILDSRSAGVERQGL